jgi:flagellar basal-body rod modification protein FlgD
MTVTPTTTTPPPTTTDKTALGLASLAGNFNTFLSLLTTQLKNQDPTAPMDSTQMISQTSQLASMEQLTALNSSTTDSYNLQMRSAAANIVGKDVSWTDADGAPQHGVASAVSFSGTTPTVTVGDATVALTALTGVGAAAPASPTS